MDGFLEGAILCLALATMGARGSIPLVVEVILAEYNKTAFLNSTLNRPIGEDVVVRWVGWMQRFEAKDISAGMVKYSCQLLGWGRPVQWGDGRLLTGEWALMENLGIEIEFF